MATVGIGAMHVSQAKMTLHIDEEARVPMAYAMQRNFFPCVLVLLYTSTSRGMQHVVCSSRYLIRF